MSESFKPRRVPPRWFKPCPETIWSAPDAWDENDTQDVAAWLTAMASAYVELLTHPCGMEMLKNARRGWKAIEREERRAGT